jgi:hypothetical protein
MAWQIPLPQDSATVVESCSARGCATACIACVCYPANMTQVIIFGTSRKCKVLQALGLDRFQPQQEE